MRSTYTKEELSEMATNPFTGDPEARMSRDIIGTLDPSKAYTIGDVACIALDLFGNIKKSRAVKNFLNNRAALYDPAG